MRRPRTAKRKSHDRTSRDRASRNRRKDEAPLLTAGNLQSSEMDALEKVEYLVPGGFETGGRKMAVGSQAEEGEVKNGFRAGNADNLINSEGSESAQDRALERGRRRHGRRWHHRHVNRSPNYDRERKRVDGDVKRRHRRRCLSESVTSFEDDSISSADARRHRCSRHGHKSHGHRHRRCPRHLTETESDSMSSYAHERLSRRHSRHRDDHGGKEPSRRHRRRSDRHHDYHASSRQSDRRDGHKEISARDLLARSKRKPDESEQSVTTDLSRDIDDVSSKEVVAPIRVTEVALRSVVRKEEPQPVVKQPKKYKFRLRFRVNRKMQKNVLHTVFVCGNVPELGSTIHPHMVLRNGVEMSPTEYRDNHESDVVLVECLPGQEIQYRYYVLDDDCGIVSDEKCEARKLKLPEGKKALANSDFIQIDPLYGSLAKKGQLRRAISVNGTSDSDSSVGI